jgi:hypothetical protein
VQYVSNPSMIKLTVRSPRSSALQRRRSSLACLHSYIHPAAACCRSRGWPMRPAAAQFLESCKKHEPLLAAPGPSWLFLPSHCWCPCFNTPAAKAISPIVCDRCTSQTDHRRCAPLHTGTKGQQKLVLGTCAVGAAQWARRGRTSKITETAGRRVTSPWASQKARALYRRPRRGGNT